jgi:hypothetical protein
MPSPLRRHFIRQSWESQLFGEASVLDELVKSTTSVISCLTSLTLLQSSFAGLTTAGARPLDDIFVMAPKFPSQQLTSTSAFATNGNGELSPADAGRLTDWVVMTAFFCKQQTYIRISWHQVTLRGRPVTNKFFK